MVTETVAQEISSGERFPDFEAVNAALQQAWLQTITLQGDSVAECNALMALHHIDAGEASALVLAGSQQKLGHEVLVIVDDTRGRQAALHARIPLTGTVGVLKVAKQLGLIPALKPLLQAMQAQGYFLSHPFVASVLAQVGEV